MHAQINYEHFPPSFVRFIARTTGPDGPAGHDMNLLNEHMLDTFLENIQGVAADDLPCNGSNNRAISTRSTGTNVKPLDVRERETYTVHNELCPAKSHLSSGALLFNAL